MSTTKRASKNADVRAETLVEFSAQVDAHYGRPLGFADLVTDLATVRADVARLQQRRDELRAEIRRRFDHGTRVVRTNGRGGGVFVYESEIPQAVRRGAPSAAVKKASPSAWEAAKVWKPFVQAVAPAVATLALGVYAMPPEPSARTDSAALVEAYRSALFDSIARLHEREEAIVEELRELCDRTDWDGAAIVFADGWKVGVRRREYDSDRLREIEPTLWEKLAVSSGGGVTRRLALMDLGDAVRRGYVELEQTGE